MKNFFSIALCCILFLASCKQDDTTPPKFKMNGESTMTISLNSSFNDPGVTAEDDEDGSVNVSSDISLTNPDVNLTGHYIITYSVTDAAGNSNKITRNVLVINDAEFMAGGYDVLYSCGLNYQDGIIPSTTHNNRIIFNQIGRCANANLKLEADIDFTTLTVNVVPATINCGTFPNIADISFSGAGAISANNDTVLLQVYQAVLPSGPADTCFYKYVRQ